MRNPVVRVTAEFGGTAFLLAVIVGSGIMAQRLSAGNEGVALLANSIATGAGLYVLIAALLPTGAHFNPAVTALAAWKRGLSPQLALICVVAQFAGAVVGVLVAHAMFCEPLVQQSVHDRAGWPLAFFGIRRHPGPAGCGLADAKTKYRGRRGDVHPRGVLVYCVNVFRQPCCHRSSCAH